MRLTFLVLTKLAVLTGLVASGGAAHASDNGPWLAALSSQYTLVDLQTGDLDGDGADETAVCYRENPDSPTGSGVVILKGRGDDLRPVFQAELDAVECEKVRIQGRKLGILLRATAAAGKRQLIWTYGDEIHYASTKGGVLDGARITASSAMPSNKPAAAFDSDLRTSWAEAAPGTGIGETLTIRFAKPTDVAAIGIFGGNGRPGDAFFDHNRIHRASVQTKTEADLGDSSAGIDFSTLGIDSIGDRIDIAADNKAEVRYVHVGRHGVVELQLRIESVYLGDRRDETHVAEIEVVPLVGLAQTIDRSTPLKGQLDVDKKGAPSAALKLDAMKNDRAGAGPLDAGAEPADRAMKTLDEGGRSLVGEDQN